MTIELTHHKPKELQTGRDIIAHMKKIKAQAQEKIDTEIDRLFANRLKCLGKSDKENMALCHELEKTQAQLLEQEIKNNPELAGCFYEKTSQGKTEEQAKKKTIKAMSTQYDQAFIECLEERYKKAAMISRAYCMAGTIISALAIFIYMTH